MIYCFLTTLTGICRGRLLRLELEIERMILYFRWFNLKGVGGMGGSMGS